MSVTKYFIAALLLIFALAQFLQFGIILGVKMANANNGITVDAGGRLAINGTLFVLAGIGAIVMWR